MKIVHIITRMIRGGAQENTLLSLIGQQGSGHDVTLITGPTTGPEGSLLNDAAGISIIEIPSLIRAVSPANDLKAYFMLRRTLKELKPEVVHTHSSKAGIIGRIAAWHEKVPFICHTIHGLPFHEYQNSLINKLYIVSEKFAAKHCHQIISVCDIMTEKALAAGIGKKEMYQTVYSGMKTEGFINKPPKLRSELRLRYNISEDSIVIGKVARLFELKGHDYLLDTFAQIKDEYPQVKLMFVGDGLWRERLENKAKKMGIYERIIWTGLLHPDEVTGAISAMDVLVHCSLREGLARVLPQALLAGKPVISFDIDGAREVIINNQTGWLIQPKDLTALRNALREVLDNLPHANTLAQNGKALCEKRFDYKLMNQQLIEIYTKSLTERRDIK